VFFGALNLTRKDVASCLTLPKSRVNHGVARQADGAGDAPVNALLVNAKQQALGVF
jgi:hypothetical protein